MRALLVEVPPVLLGLAAVRPVLRSEQLVAVVEREPGLREWLREPLELELSASL